MANTKKISKAELLYKITDPAFDPNSLLPTNTNTTNSPTLPKIKQSYIQEQQDKLIKSKLPKPKPTIPQIDFDKAVDIDNLYQNENEGNNRGETFTDEKKVEGEPKSERSLTDERERPEGRVWPFRNALFSKPLTRESLKYATGNGSRYQSKPPTPVKRNVNHTEFLKVLRLKNLERMAAIAHDQVWHIEYKEDGVTEIKRQRLRVPLSVQLEALGALLDRDLGKAKVAIDVATYQRPMVFDPAFAEPPIQGEYTEETQVVQEEVSGDSPDTGEGESPLLGG